MQREIHYVFPLRIFSKVREKENKSLIVIIISLSIIFSSFLFEAPPVPFDVCLFKIVTGLPCPSCGLTHSFLSIGHFRLRDAVIFNIMGPFLYVALVVIFCIALIEFFYKKSLLTLLWVKTKNYIFVGIVSIAIISWIWNLFKEFLYSKI